MREAWGCRWERAPQGITFLSVAPWILPPPPRTVAQEIPLTCLAHTLVELSREGLSWRLGFFA